MPKVVSISLYISLWHIFLYKRIKVSHLTSVKLARVDAKTVYEALKNYWNTNNLPFTNLISVRMDSCSVMRGGKSGVKVKLHLPDIVTMY